MVELFATNNYKTNQNIHMGWQKYTDFDWNKIKTDVL